MTSTTPLPARSRLGPPPVIALHTRSRPEWPDSVCERIADSADAQLTSPRFHQRCERCVGLFDDPYSSIGCDAWLHVDLARSLSSVGFRERSARSSSMGPSRRDSGLPAGNDSRAETARGWRASRARRAAREPPQPSDSGLEARRLAVPRCLVELPDESDGCLVVQVGLPVGRLTGLGPGSPDRTAAGRQGRVAILSRGMTGRGAGWRGCLSYGRPAFFIAHGSPAADQA
jgi:hypothetical protein